MGAMEGLTALTDEELTRLLRHVYRGDLDLPLEVVGIARVGFQQRQEILLEALRGVPREGVQAVIACVLAERRKAREAAAVRLPPARRDPHVANAGEVEWTELLREGELRLRRKQLGAAAGAKKLGCSLVELQPGQRSWPLHYHLGNEEGIYVLEGRPFLRLGEKNVRLEPGDYVALPAEKASAHQMINPSGQPIRYLCVSTMEQPDVTVYPDSGKIAVFAGAAPGGPKADRTLEAVLPLDAAVDYWKDEQ